MAKNAKPRTAIEFAVKRLAKFAKVGPGNAGAEWWVQVLSPPFLCFA